MPINKKTRWVAGQESWAHDYTLIKRQLLLPAHYLRNGMADHCSCLFDFFASQPRRDADFQRWDEILLWFEAIVKVLESGDKNTVGKTLHMVRSASATILIYQNLPRQRHLAVKIAGPRTRASSTQPPRASAAE